MTDVERVAEEGLRSRRGPCCCRGRARSPSARASPRRPGRQGDPRRRPRGSGRGGPGPLHRRQGRHPGRVAARQPSTDAGGPGAPCCWTPGTIGSVSHIADPDTGSVRDDLVAMLGELAEKDARHIGRQGHARSRGRSRRSTPRCVTCSPPSSTTGASRPSRPSVGSWPPRAAGGHRRRPGPRSAGRPGVLPGAGGRQPARRCRRRHGRRHHPRRSPRECPPAGRSRRRGVVGRRQTEPAAASLGNDGARACG